MFLSVTKRRVNHHGHGRGSYIAASRSRFSPTGQVEIGKLSDEVASGAWVRLQLVSNTLRVISVRSPTSEPIM